MEGETAVTEGGTVLSLGTAGLVISSGGVQTTVPVTPAEASADAAALGDLIGMGYNAANVTGSGGGSGGPVVFTGNGSGWGTGRRSLGVLGVLILMGLNIVLMGLFGLG